MAQCIGEEAHRRNVHNVVDFGSGQGYLSQVLAFALGLNVVAIDNDEHQTQGSQTRQAQITKNLRNKPGLALSSYLLFSLRRTPSRHPPQKIGKGGFLSHMTCHVSPETFSEILEQGSPCTTPSSTPANLSNVISQMSTPALIAPLPVSTGADKWLICGLHTCGDLAPTMIRSFVQSSADVLVNVGCCYHFLSDNSGWFFLLVSLLPKTQLVDTAPPHT